MLKQPYTEAKANKKWDEENKERARYINVRPGARSFIRNKSTLDDLQELRKLINHRESESESQQ